MARSEIPVSIDPIADQPQVIVSPTQNKLLERANQLMNSPGLMTSREGYIHIGYQTQWNQVRMYYKIIKTKRTIPAIVRLQGPATWANIVHYTLPSPIYLLTNLLSFLIRSISPAPEATKDERIGGSHYLIWFIIIKLYCITSYTNFIFLYFCVCVSNFVGERYHSYWVTGFKGFFSFFSFHWISNDFFIYLMWFHGEDHSNINRPCYKLEKKNWFFA